MGRLLLCVDCCMVFLITCLAWLPLVGCCLLFVVCWFGDVLCCCLSLSRLVVVGGCLRMVGSCGCCGVLLLVVCSVLMVVVDRCL